MSRRRATIRSFATIVRAVGTTIREPYGRAIVRAAFWRTIIRSLATAIIYSPLLLCILRLSVVLAVLHRRLGRLHSG